MTYGLLLTGTSGAGKSTLASWLCHRDSHFRLVKAVTTRAPRPDDSEGQYAYLCESQFDELEDSNQLLIRAEYRGLRYGITHAHVNDVRTTGAIPVIVATPDSVARYSSKVANGNETERFKSVFIDAPDETLDSRLLERDSRSPSSAIGEQRIVDRRFASGCDHVIMNVDLDEAKAKLLALLS